MTTDQKIIKNRVGLLELAKQLGNVSAGVQDPRLLAGQFLSLQGALRDRWRGGVGRHLEEKADRQESCRARDRRGGREDRFRVSRLRTGTGKQRASKEKYIRFARRCARRLVASRSGNFQKTTQGSRSESRSRGDRFDRRPTCRPGTRKRRKSRTWSDRNRASRLSRLPRYVLCRHAERCRASISADVCRHLHSRRFRQALRPQKRTRRRRHAQRSRAAFLRRTRR